MYVDERLQMFVGQIKYKKKPNEARPNSNKLKPKPNLNLVIKNTKKKPKSKRTFAYEILLKLIESRLLRATVTNCLNNITFIEHNTRIHEMLFANK